MSLKNKFIERYVKKPEIEEYLISQFEKYGYSHSEIRKSHTGMDIIIYANKPGLIIGRGGKNINEIADKLKENFGLERGLNFRRIGNIMLRKIMESGAIGCEIRLSGKLGSAKARVQRFYEGYLKYSGNTAKEYVDYTKATAVTKAGAIGIKVRIMKDFPEAKIKEIKEVKKEEGEKLVCPYCGKKYDNERSLKIHIGQKHSQETEKTEEKEVKEVGNTEE